MAKIIPLKLTSDTGEFRITLERTQERISALEFEALEMKQASNTIQRHIASLEMRTDRMLELVRAIEREIR